MYGYTDGPAVIVGSNVPHAFEPEGKVALLFVEPESRAGQALTGRFAGAPVARREAPCLGDAQDGLASLWTEPRPDSEMVETLGRQIVESTLDWLTPRMGEGVGLAEAAHFSRTFRRHHCN
jgi:hypothetical protein